MQYIAYAHKASGGRINEIIATSNEGIYKAKVTKKVSKQQVRNAAKNSDNLLKGKVFQSEISMWKAMNDAYTSEFAKIGIKINYEKKSKHSKKLITQKIGQY